MQFSKEHIGNVETIHESSLRVHESSLRVHESSLRVHESSLRVHESSPPLSRAPENSNIKGILFDVDGTLYHQVPLRILMIFLLLIKNIHHPVLLIKKMKVIQHFRKSQELLRTNNDRSGTGYQNQIRLTMERIGESQEFISQVVVEWFEKQPLKYLKLCRRKSLESILSSLQKQGYHLGVYSDYPANDKLHALGIGNYFTTIVSSSDPDVTGVKPHTNGFYVAAQSMRLATEEIVYVGDRPEVDGKGAIASGMKYLNVSKNFEKELTRLIER